MKMDKIIKQAQRMQAQMALAQEELQNTVLEGTAGGGAVKVTANGHGEVLSVVIDKEVVNPDDVEMLEDLVLGAIKEATSKARALSEQKMSALTGGMGVGGTMDVISGNLTRAPKAWQKCGMEWLYRVIQEPSRWRRIAKLPLFVWYLILTCLHLDRYKDDAFSEEKR